MKEKTNKGLWERFMNGAKEETTGTPHLESLVSAKILHAYGLTLLREANAGEYPYLTARWHPESSTYSEQQRWHSLEELLRELQRQDQ